MFATGIAYEQEVSEIPALQRWAKFGGEDLSRIVDRCLSTSNSKSCITTLSGLNDAVGRARAEGIESQLPACDHHSTLASSAAGQGLDKVAGNALAAVDADVEMYESAVTFIQGIFVVHGLQLRVVQNKDVHALKIPVSAEKSRLSYNFSNGGGQDSPGNQLCSWMIAAYSRSANASQADGLGGIVPCTALPAGHRRRSFFGSPEWDPDVFGLGYEEVDANGNPVQGHLRFASREPGNEVSIFFSLCGQVTFVAHLLDLMNLRLQPVDMSLFISKQLHKEIA